MADYFHGKATAQPQLVDGIFPQDDEVIARSFLRGLGSDVPLGGFQNDDGYQRYNARQIAGIVLSNIRNHHES